MISLSHRLISLSNFDTNDTPYHVVKQYLDSLKKRLRRPPKEVTSIHAFSFKFGAIHFVRSIGLQPAGKGLRLHSRLKTALSNQTCPGMW